MTFPASDPVAVGKPTSTEPPARPVDRKPPITTPAGRTSHAAAQQTKRKTRLRHHGVGRGGLHPGDPVDESGGQQGLGRGGSRSARKR